VLRGIAADTTIEELRADTYATLLLDAPPGVFA